MTSRPASVLITGATGFVGRALAERLVSEGHAVTAWVRNPNAARAVLGPRVEFVDSTGLSGAVAATDGIVNLAGESVAGVRWTRARKAAIRSSRVDTTQALADALAAAPPRGRVLVSASAVGVYGDAGDAECTEEAPGGSGFLADVCREWEHRGSAAK